MIDDLFGLLAGGGQPSRLGQVSLTRLVVAGRLLGQPGQQGQCAQERGEVGIQILDLLIPRWPEPGPQELALGSVTGACGGAAIR